MKNIFSIVVLVMLAGVYTVSAQTVSYTVKTTAKCTNLTADFTVPANKVANIKSLDVVPIFKGCDSDHINLTSLSVSVKSKVASGSKAKPIVYYKKTIEQTGLVTESVAASTVKLIPGNYVLEVSPSAGTEATLSMELFDN